MALTNLMQGNREKVRSTPESSLELDREREMALTREQQVNKLITELLSEVIDKLAFDPSRNEEGQRRMLSTDILSFINMNRIALALHLTISEKQQITNSVLDEIFGYGPITSFLDDETVSEVMVNGPDNIFVERAGKLEKANARFRDDAHVMHIIDKIIAPIGRHVDESSPMVDGRLPDGSRVNIIIPPLALKGPTVTIRKFAKDPFSLEDLVGFGTLNHSIAQFLRACVQGRMNIIISGGTGSGKTTLLNVMSGFIPETERIVTIEDAAEIQLRQPHVVTLETRPANIEGRGAVTIRDLVVNSLRMRPDRIVVGEVRSKETVDMLQAMNTGHDGSLTTVHANTPRDSLARLETMFMMSGMDLPSKAIREQISSAINVVVQVSRYPDGTRKISKVTEITGMEGDTITMQDIFEFRQTGARANGKVEGDHFATGIVPTFMESLKRKGEIIDSSIFNPSGRR